MSNPKTILREFYKPVENILRGAYFHIQNGGLSIETFEVGKRFFLLFRMENFTLMPIQQKIEVFSQEQVDEIIEQLQQVRPYLPTKDYYARDPLLYHYASSLNFEPKAIVELDNRRLDHYDLVNYLRKTSKANFRCYKDKRYVIEFESKEDALLFKLSYPK